MTKRVILDLNGQFRHQPIQVFLEMVEAGAGPRWQGNLPTHPALFQILEQWRSQYRGLAKPYREITLESVDFGASIQAQTEACQRSTQALVEQFQAWLRSEEFQPITDRFREALQPGDDICLLLRTDQPWLRQLPWQEWDLLRRYKKAEVVLCNPTSEGVSDVTQTHKTEQSQVQILAVLGNDARINIEGDRQYLQTFSPEAKTRFLVKPTREELFDILWCQPWDIFFFAGHSHTEGQHGVICLNDIEPPLPITDLSQAMAKAIDHGLQIAIFNSCDGLGLAQDLEKLHIPHLVVMREPVPDAIAQRFLKNFLGAYCRDIPLHLAVRDARESLIIKETEFPSASHLPILCQNYTSPSPTWTQLRTGSRTGGRISGHVFPPTPPAPPLVRSFSYRKAGFRAALISVFLTTLLAGVQSLGLFQAMELNAYDHFMRLRPAEGPDERFLLITVNEADKQYQDFLGMERQGSLAEDALVEIINQSKAYPPKLIGLSIHDDSPVKNQTLSTLKSAPPIVFGCEAGDSISKPIGTGPPPNLSSGNIGFTDVKDDEDDVVRRQILGMDKKEICPTNISFAFQIARMYLQEKGYEYKYKNGIAYLGNFSFHRMRHNSGPYRVNQDDFSGYQIPINYRPDNPRSINLTDVLNGSALAQEPKLFSNKIVLIGLASDSEDVYQTPYSIGQGTAGIVIHAQMASQIISAILDERPLIYVSPIMLSNLWLYIWLALGVFLILSIQSIKGVSIAVFVEILTFNGVYALLFFSGLWLPYTTVILAHFLIGLLVSVSPRTVKLFGT